MVQIAAIAATVIIIAIIAWAWSRKQGAGRSGVPVEAFAHVVEEQARQTEALRSAVEGLSEVVHQIRMLLETRRSLFPSPVAGCRRRTMPDPALSQALKEAFASAPAGTVILDTLEIWHPTFNEPIRVVRDTPTSPPGWKLVPPRWRQTGDLRRAGFRVLAAAGGYRSGAGNHRHPRQCRQRHHRCP
jgi:hypothetical protein